MIIKRSNKKYLCPNCRNFFESTCDCRYRES